MSIIDMVNIMDNFINMIRLFDVALPQITKWELKEKIANLQPDKKLSLYWFYSEFLLRANRNSWYKKVLNEASLSAIDGKGLHWSMFKVMKTDFLPELYSTKLYNLNIFVRIPVFVLLYLIQLFLNFLSGFYHLVIAKTNFSIRTKNETVLGRDFTYDLLTICAKKRYKTMIIGGSNADDSTSISMIKKMYPELDLVLWTRKTDSLLMKDELTKTIEEESFYGFFNNFLKPKPFLTTENLYQRFPDLLEAKKAVIEAQPDVILTCLGGASGKQEFFIHDLVNSVDTKFMLATGLGAAVDHLGGGKKQSLPPKWMQKAGLEWLFRFFDQPYRRLRIIDSIFTLYWWTTLYQFTQELNNKRNVIANYIVDQNANLLLTNNKSIIPSELGWGIPQAPISKRKSIEESGVISLKNDYNLLIEPSNFVVIPERGMNVQHSVSIIKFLSQECYYISNQYYFNYIGLPFPSEVNIHIVPPKMSLGCKFIPIEEGLKFLPPHISKYSPNIEIIKKINNGFTNVTQPATEEIKTLEINKSDYEKQ